jgi:hypothetical protein
MSILTNEPVTIDLDDTEDWEIQFNDTDLSGQPIPHTGQTLQAVFKDAQGNIVFTAESEDEISIVGGTSHSILISVPWATVATFPAGELTATLVQIVSDTRRKKIIDVTIRYEKK